MTWIVPAVFVIGFVAILFLNTASFGDGLSAVSTWLAQTFGAERFSMNYAVRGHPAHAHPAAQKKSPGGAEAITRIALSAILLIASLYVILSGTFAQDEKNWAFTTIGALTGFWLKA